MTYFSFMYFTDQLFSASHGFFFKIANREDIDLKFQCQFQMSKVIILQNVVK